MDGYAIGDICYFIGDNDEVQSGRISAKKEHYYFVQRVGCCGALQLELKDIFHTKEEAENSRNKSAVHVVNHF